MFLKPSLPGLRDVVVLDPVGAPAEGRDHPHGEDDLLRDPVHRSLLTQLLLQRNHVVIGANRFLCRWHSVFVTHM